MLSAQDMQEAAAHGRHVRAVYVYEAPVRLWHWVNALAITVLAVSGWFIASPLPSQPGGISRFPRCQQTLVVAFHGGHTFRKVRLRTTMRQPSK